MNKKLFLGMFAAAGMLLATSCSNDELDVVQSGNEAQVTFSLAAEGGIATRAISDGKSAKKLVYAVYDANGKLIETIANADVNGQIVDNSAFDNGLTENVTITLAKGQQYTVAFWAQDPNCTAYTTTDLEKVMVNYAGLNNDETRDAFFKAETFTVTGNTEIDVVLKRPFAQINVGVYQSDWDAAVASEIEIEKSKVTIEKAATSINLLTGEVDGEETVEYGFDIIPAKFTASETLDVDLNNDGTKENYVYLSMSYILANDKTTGYAKTTLEDLDFTFAPKNGNNINFSEGLNAVPVQRNWRTNIIGKILTGDVTFNITIDPIYDGEYNNGEALGVKANNRYYATINEAVSAGATEIELAAGLWIMPSVSNKTLKITGSNKDAKIDLTNAVNLSGTSIDFKNVTIVKENENYVGFYHSATLNYTDCIFENEYWAYGIETFDNCVFNQTSSNNYNVWTYGAKTATFNNCTFNSAGKSVLVYKETGSEWYKATFNNCVFNASTPVEGKSAIEIDSSLNPYEVTISSCKASGFAKGSVSGNILYNLKKGTLDTNCKIILKGTNTIAEDLAINENGEFVASSQNGLNNAINEGALEILLTEGEYKMPSATANKTVTITGTKDVVVNVNKDGTDSQHTSGSTITFEGVTIQGAPNNYRGFPHTNAVNFKNCTIIDKLTLYSNTVFDNCTFETSTEHCVWTYGSKDVKFKDCKFSYSDRCVNVYIDNGTEDAKVVFENCVFTPTAASSKGAVEINSSVFPNGVEVDFTACVSPAYGEMVFISGWDSTNGATATVTIDGSTVTAPQLAK